MRGLVGSPLTRKVAGQIVSKQPQNHLWTAKERAKQYSFSNPHQRTFQTSSKMSTTKDWSAAQYLKFEAERTRPSRDLLAQVPLKSPKHIVDLGCGPGNSTAVIASYYPNAQVTGMDSSPDMIAKAKKTLPKVDFTLADLSTYIPSQPADLLFTNAVFQWLPNADRIPIITNLINSQPSGGVFALQVPDNFTEPSHSIMREVAKEGPWAETLNRLNPARDQFQSPQELYDALKPLCESVDLWHTHYQHVLDNHEAIVEWVKGTGLRPFIDPLTQEEKDGFIAEYLRRLKTAYKAQVDGKVLLKYPRLFLVAVKK